MKLQLSSLLSYGLIAASLGVMAWTTSSLGIHASTAQNRGAEAGADTVLLLGDNPYKISFDPVRVDPPWDPAEMERFLGWIADPIETDPRNTSLSRMSHAARLLSLSGRDPAWLKRERKTYVTRVKLPKQSIWRTWRGLEVAESAEGKPTEHRDQTLAALAESGVPLSAVIESEDGDFHVYDLLRTSLHEFHLDQEEISWTAAAYIRYLPPQTTWQNRYGEQFSLDHLAEEMLRRPLPRASCAGTHLVMVLTEFAKVDRGLGILSSNVRSRLVAYLRSKLSQAVDSQLDDGSWTHCWSPSDLVEGLDVFTPADTDVNRVTATGHLLEWFHLLPEDLKPPARTVESGTVWIRSILRSTPKETVAEAFCPYTHAIVSLNLAAPPPTR
ncbi:hypothetical protein [Paludisphaera mucosa]|uniref:Secreted protein n=1 Tax=Paludisphaera mucosa TaxID=3030827 RepID=A0ABT6FEJ3_9BACT|nr:hypothetical protein [Paludisphaera mucosa]MDG3005992.1 hypothetical protein [Paludisphaera mucosa]